ncbi:BREX-1 system adenine-specific DNA-methyltransferase PglX [Bacilli bacterium]|nr:restriction endonuclease [Bacilli bacterium VT-13-104]PZD86419.1 BREX-1 system adenine-specific DNA-methyltransferase PglX [Bacilli bacterium]PZD88069.1 BREX-1 system adenine-specific DNA-methyltransferase PglX [Bacilli bacterium]PZD90991.1 BREX-1 system adenine-specific DNA-methyltransferase PglX [Bacilli bacterium]RCO05048.1 BREX-1 system adenine-specific DNA-methyltransferase PglX [Bacilli bacterium]
MNKTELKKFAVEARRDLLEKVALKAEQYGITKENPELTIEENYGQLIVNGKTFPTDLKHALHTLQNRLNTVGYEQLIEEVAYTWFNRIIAIRYMEVNNYLPDRVNVLSSSSGKNEPDILLQYETMNLDIDEKQIKDLIHQGDNEQAYRKLFIAQCNALNQLLPFLFEKIEDYTELLLPDYLLDQESIIRKIVNELSDENFYQVQEDGSPKDNVEVLGWLYQYYMSEKKEKVGGLKNTAVKKEDLPVVTQLFTPKWIVQYMVQNSLGKLYDEKYEDNQLAKHWEYYLKHEENHHLYSEFDSLEDLKIMDPACGSGHILLYAFDMLYDMYEEAGYPSREIPQLILENNLYGLDIDKRAQQIANFALLMKAAEKQPRFISRLSRKGINPKLNVYEIVDADQSLSEEAIDYFVENETEKSLIKELMDQFENGKQFGSLINPIEVPYMEWKNRINDMENQQKDLIEESYSNELKEKLLPVLKQAYLLYQKYDVVVTNPPYHNKYNPVLKKFMNKEYNDYKTDLYSAFIYKTSLMTKENGYSGLMTPFTWMFILSHKKLRNYVLSEAMISSLVELEYSAFEEATVPICTFVIQNQLEKTLGHYIRLEEFKGADMQPIKLRDSVVNPNVEYRFRRYSSSFSDISGSPIAYWASEQVRKIFRESMSIDDVAEPKQGLATGKNERFLRWWFEPSSEKIYKNNINKYKWVPVSKGGAFRKWYGNRNFVVDWEDNGKELKKFTGSVIRNPTYYFREGLTWSTVTSGNVSFRYHPDDSIFETKGSVLFPKDNKQLKILFGYLNSNLVNYFLKSISPTLDYHEGPMGRLPYIPTENVEIEKMVSENINIAKADWDSFESSWDFITHPFINNKLKSTKLSETYTKWEKECEERFQTLKKNEELLNELFINLYGLRGELNSSIEDKYVSVSKAELNRDSKSFISYFIGCLMGRYSLDIEGLAYAGGEFDESKYKTFKPNPNGLILLTDDHYFENDIIVRLREFLSVAFSPDTVDENMRWLAESLEMKKNESPEERLRRYFLDEFFKDHCKTYQKRPIYWLVDSGKQKGLRTLIYMHRYQPDTMATIRFDHLQEIQAKYQNEIEMIDTRLANPSLSATDRRNLEKDKISYQKKIEELQEFDKHLAVYANEPIEIDLDDGVKVNYAKFDKVLAKIK